MDFAAPIRVGGLTQGVLCMHSSWEWVRETMQTLQQADSGDRQIGLFIFDRHGKIIHAPGDSLEPLQALDQRLPVAHTVSADTSDATLLPVQVARWQDSPQSFLTATVPLQAHNRVTAMGWHIVARQPHDSAYAPARQAMHQVLAGGLAAALVAAVIAWLVARRLSQDLKRLARAANGIDGSGAAPDIPQLHSSREVHRLSQALRGSIAQLRSANEAMERQVRERTLQLQQANAELEHQARSDPLTGLLNRRGFDFQLDFAMALARRSGRPLSVLVIDVDHFKRINDQHGHDMGDAVLRTLARAFRMRLRESDVLARMGARNSWPCCPTPRPTRPWPLQSNCANCWPPRPWPTASPSPPAWAWPRCAAPRTRPPPCCAVATKRCTRPRAQAATTCSFSAETAPRRFLPPRLAACRKTPVREKTSH
ncbi:GGDEF domain-containing protein [Delftia lacustris]|uniref:GGDEF domain-containing protein n=1 Tax=Delftia lacustris TaxID=558537 RepID=UPI003B96CBFD